MSYENVPKNLARSKVLVEPFDYGLEVASGNIQGVSEGVIRCRGSGLPNGSWVTIWDNNQDYVRLTADTQLYISSTSASDTMLVAVEGLDENYNLQTYYASLSGQTQVAISGLLFRPIEVRVLGDVPIVGEIYLAEADTLTGGVPDTSSKIKTKVAYQTGETNPEYVSLGISQNGFYTVPAGKRLHFVDFLPSCGKQDDITLDLRVKFLGQPWWSVAQNYVYQSGSPTYNWTRISLPEKTEIEFRARSSTNNGTIDVQSHFYLVDN